MQGSHDYLGRVGAVNRALMTVDPAGVCEGNPTFGSEYDAEAREIARRWIRESATEEALASIVGEVVGEWMGVAVDTSVAQEVVRGILDDVAGTPRRRELELVTAKAFLRSRH